VLLEPASPLYLPSPPNRWLLSTDNVAFLFVSHTGASETLCAHLKSHHCLGESLTCSQTRSGKPPTSAAQGGKGLKFRKSPCWL
jgi:hypothetical protein